MKEKFYVLAVMAFMVSHVEAIGISPGRWPSDITEYNSQFNSSMGYTLIRPGTRYSLFTVYDAAGLTGIITGCSASNSFEYLDDKSILIDWESPELASVGTITASIQMQSPIPWDCPAEPGGGVYITDLVRHSDVIQTGSGISAGVAAISEVALWRNYAPKIHLLDSQNIAEVGQSANFAIQFDDKMPSWFSRYSDRDYNGGPWLSYSVDWDSDGVVDFNGTATWDEEPEYDSYYKIYRWTSGIQTSTLSLDHIYNQAGDYITTIKVWDGLESTIIEIPINVVPEPATLLLLTLGGLFLRRR